MIESTLSKEAAGSRLSQTQKLPSTATAIPSGLAASTANSFTAATTTSTTASTASSVVDVLEYLRKPEEGKGAQAGAADNQKGGTPLDIMGFLRKPKTETVGVMDYILSPSNQKASNNTYL